MARNAIDPAADDGAGTVRFLGGLEQTGHSKKPRERQVGSAEISYQRVTGDVGPIHLIGGPRVVVERHASRAFVWVENPIWGWPDARREFLNPDSPSILKYAQLIAARIRVAALQEEVRSGKIADCRKREADAFRAERGARR